MGYFYFDESIQAPAGFIAGAWVYSDADLTPPVFEVLTAAGLAAGRDEFKSGSRMADNPQQLKARDGLWSLLGGRSIGTVIAPVEQRECLGVEALAGLARFIQSNQHSYNAHEVFLDEGIPVSSADIERFLESVPMPCRVWPQQDSRTVGGIQLADLVSHSLGIMLLGSMGFISKTVKAGPDSGYDPDLDIDLEFEMFASLRYPLLKAPMPIPKGEDPVGDLVYEVEGYGLHIANSCSAEIANAARERFGRCYMGCIH